MKTLCLLTLAVVGAMRGAEPETPATSATDAIPLTSAYINQLADELQRHHPALRAAGERALSAAAGVDAVRTWEDPTLVLGGMVADTAMRADQGDIIYGVQQKLPLFGKSQRVRRVAQAGQAIEEASRVYRFQLLRRELAKALFRTALASQTVQIDGQDLVWLDTLAATIDQRLAAGQASQMEVLRVQNERAKRLESIRADRSRLTNEQVTLNRLLSRKLEAPWPALELPPLAQPVAYSLRLADLAVRYEPKLKVLQQELKQAEASIDLVRRQRYPDFTAGLEGRNYSGNGDFREGEFLLSFNFPLGNAKKYRSDIRREEARRDSMAFEFVDYELSVRQEVHQLTVEIDNARREALLYRDEIVPRTEKGLAVLRASWESGRVPFYDLMEARRMLLEGQLMYARAVADQWQRLADLVLCCGLADFEALDMIGVLPDTAALPAKQP